MKSLIFLLCLYQTIAQNVSDTACIQKIEALAKTDATTELAELTLSCHRQYPQNQQIQYFHALSLLGSRELTQALTLFESGIKQDPENAQNYLLALQTKLDMESASADLMPLIQSIEQKFAKDSAVIAECANLLIQHARMQTAFELLERGIENEEGETFIYHLKLGQMYLQIRHHEDAIEQFKTAIEENPQYSLSHMYLGEAFEGLDRFDDAKKSYQTALKLGLPGDLQQNLQNYLPEIGKGNKSKSELDPASFQKMLSATSVPDKIYTKVEGTETLPIEAKKEDPILQRWQEKNPVKMPKQPEF